MAMEIRIPEIGESVSEVFIEAWSKSEGERVEKDEVLCVLESDKATIEFPAPRSGRLTRIAKDAGETAEVGDIIAYLDDGEGEDEAENADESGERDDSVKSEKAAEGKGSGERRQVESSDGQEQESEKEGAQADQADQAETEDEAETGSKTEGISEAEAEAEAEDEEEDQDRDAKDDDGKEQAKEKRKPRELAVKPRLMPAAAKELEKHDIDPQEIEGSGPAGRVLREDVLRFLRDRKKEPAAPVASPAPKKTRKDRAPDADSDEDVRPLSPIRKAIARRLLQAQHEMALLTTFNEIDMSAVRRIREELGAAFKERYETSLGLMPFFVKAAVAALKRVPEVNAEIRDEQVVLKRRIHIGIAVGSGKGLVVPVLRDADRMDFAAIEKRVRDVAERAAKNRLEPGELKGGTFTISNGGVYGSLLSTPIVNPPQSGVLGMHAIQERPVARDGEIVIRPMMYVALTYDHRLVDGREAVTFLRHIKECVEDPARLALGL